MVDVTVRGAGIFGLSVAWACALRGASVRVVDPAHVDALLDAIAEAGHREVALRALLVLSKADGAISPPEQGTGYRALSFVWMSQCEPRER